MVQFIKFTSFRNILLLFALTWVSSIFCLTSSVLAQEDETYVVDTIETSAYFDEDNNVVNVSGIVNNSTGIDIENVEIIGLLVYGEDNFIPGTTSISKIEMNDTAFFELEIEATDKPSSFLVQVLSYKLDTQNVDLLFEYFWMYEDDYVLHQAVVTFFESPPSDTIPQIINRFKTNETQRGNVQATLTEDLILLPVLSKNQTVDAIQALSDKGSLYSDQHYQETFAEMKAEIDDDNESEIPLLNQAYQSQDTLIEIWYDALLSIDEDNIPEQNVSLREKLGALYLERGKELRSSWDQENAIEYLEKAKLYLGKSVQIEISKASVREKWFIILIGIGIVIVTSSIIREEQKI